MRPLAERAARAADAADGADASWPALGHETLGWDSPYLGVATRPRLRRYQGPYQAAIVPEIAAVDLALPSAALAAAEDAATEIAHFDAELSGEIDPFAALLLRSESAASSRIEDLTAAPGAIAGAEIGLVTRCDATQIVANTQATEAAVRRADRLDSDAILATHRALMEPHQPDIAGRWRHRQVWIGGSHFGPHDAVFVPPHHDRVVPAVADLVAFLRRDDLPVLAQAAIAHAQFETIRPFPDGNGRTGRALLHAVLRGRGLTRRVIVPISAGLLAAPRAYIEALTRYRAGDPSAIVMRLADAAGTAVANGRRLVADLHSARDGWNDRICARPDASVWRLADLLVRRPVVNAQLVADELGITATNVYRPIGLLVRAGVLTEFTDQKRNRAWGATEILTALEAFAARCGRRCAGRA